MNKSMYAAGTVALTLMLSGLPVVALAESSSDEGRGDSSIEIDAQTQEVHIQQNVSARDGEGKQESKDQREKAEMANSDEQKSGENMKSDEQDEQDEQEIELELEDDEDLASSFDDLKQKIEVRKHELDDEEASTTPKFKNAVKNANEVRLAVHSLLASKELLGGIGSEVSQIAKDMNDSVATTTNAEAKIQARNFFARLFFGGDSVAADVISQQVARNQQHIDDLTKLLEGANVPADIQAVLKAQIMAIQDAQTRLLDLAQKEQKQWGLFSWRF